MDEQRVYEAANYAKYGRAVLEETFQLDDGKPYYADRFNGINLSGLFSFLIKEAGRLCDNYASDMFYDMKELNNRLAGDSSELFDNKEFRYIIGIRDSGVDSIGFMQYRIDSESCVYHYREVILIEITPDEKYEGMRKLSVWKVSPTSMDFYFREHEEVTA